MTRSSIETTNSTACWLVLDVVGTQARRSQAVTITTGLVTVAQSPRNTCIFRANVTLLNYVQEWPSYSPDLNPMDFSIWASERGLSEDQLLRELAEILQNVLRTACSAFVARLDDISHTKGGHSRNKKNKNTTHYFSKKNNVVTISCDNLFLYLLIPPALQLKCSQCIKAEHSILVNKK